MQDLWWAAMERIAWDSFDRCFTFLSAAWNFHKETMGGYSGVCVSDSLLFSDVFEEYREKI